MANPVLVIMAAGMGSRYGGLKQIDPIGPNGQIILGKRLYMDGVQCLEIPQGRELLRQHN